MMARHEDVERFYELLEELEQRVGGARKLKNCTGYMDWPERGVYFFLEPGETRESTDQLRVTRVGTHAVSAGSSTSLWDRLKRHYGTGNGSSHHPHGGAHRGSVYRKRVGEAIIEKHELQDDYPSWNDRWSTIDRERFKVRDEEYILERRVSTYIRDQPFLWSTSTTNRVLVVTEQSSSRIRLRCSATSTSNRLTHEGTAGSVSTVRVGKSANQASGM
jgi:hypothetical protein